MRRILIAAPAALALACLCLAFGCRTGQPGTGGNPGRKGDSNGLEFDKLSEGLRYESLDYIGTEGFTLAGARGGGRIFFGVETQGGYKLYRRDLQGRDRRTVGDFSNVVSGTLSTDNAGEWLFYCRDRELGKYIDDPAVKAPARIGVLYRMKSSGGAEEALFDFRDPAYLPFRKYDLVPFCSPSGQRAAALSFDYDQSLLAMQCDDWLAFQEATYQGGPEVKPEDVPSREEQLRKFFELPRVAAFLSESGRSATTSGKLTEADRQLVVDFQASLGLPRWAILLWEAGQPSVIEVAMPAGMERAPLVLQAVGESVIVLSIQSTDEKGTPYSILYTLDISSGNLVAAGRYTGVPSNLQLDATEKAMLIALTPYDPERKVFEDQPVLRRQPLDASAPEDIPLPGRFERSLDFDPAATEAVGQDTEDRDIYHIDLASGEKTLLCRLNTEITGIFYSPDIDKAVFLENGFTFSLPVPLEPEQDPDWVQPDSFAQADAAAREFLSRLGMQLPEAWEAEWEERSTPGLHEYSAQITLPETRAKPILIRINAIDGLSVEALWMPGGYPLPASADLQGGDLDAIDCEKRAETALDHVGWLSETRSKYQPGGSPIYDDPSKSYVIVHRDGYSANLNGKDEWVFSAESTIRVNKVSGEIAEMNLMHLPEVTGQKTAIPMEEVLTSIRNKGPQPIPESAPVRFDTQNYRLVVADKGRAYWGPARLELPGTPRLCYEIDGFLQPEDQLIMTTRVDMETGDVLGQVTFLPSNQQKALGRM